MATLNFWTAVKYGNGPKSFGESLLEGVDDYFNVSGKSATVIRGEVRQGCEGVLCSDLHYPFAVTALKVASYLALAGLCLFYCPIALLPIAGGILGAKILLRHLYKFHILDAKQKIEEGVMIPEEVVQRISILMEKKSMQSTNSEITWCHRSRNSLAFKLEGIPQLIFKTPNVENPVTSHEIAEERLKNMAKAQEVCWGMQFDQLVIPHARKFEVDGRAFIAEQHLEVDQSDGAQERLYKDEGLDQDPSRNKDFSEAIRQLAHFIISTGYSNVNWPKIPILEPVASNPQAKRKIALLGFGTIMQGAQIGIFGNKENQGLFHCLFFRAQMDDVLTIANVAVPRIHHPYGTSEKAKQARFREIAAG